MQNPLRLVSLNIEGNRHLDKIIPFFYEQQPDVICLQEVFISDFENLKRELQMDGHFVPLAFWKRNGSLEHWGVAILSKPPFQNPQFRYYKGDPNQIPDHIDGVPNSLNRALLWTTITKDGQNFTVATTHFTRTPDGAPDDEQRRDFHSLKGVLNTIPEIILCGDFNAPRGKEIFDELSKMYTDNIPPEIISTIDPDLHKTKGSVQFVVDALFTSAQYHAENVGVICGVSDHCAVVGEIALN